MRGKPLAGLVLAVFLTGLCAAAPHEQEKKEMLAYPKTKKVDVVDTYHGTKIADPYRWLEDDRAQEVTTWVEEQNRVTFSYLSKIPFRNKIKSRLEELYNYPRYSAPFRIGDYYFFNKNTGLQNQSVIYYQKGLQGEAQVFLDPNTLSKDGTVRVGLLGESQDNRYMAISRSEAGSDWEEIRVIEIATKREPPTGSLGKIFRCWLAWQRLFYSRYDLLRPEKR